jgi:hypothetical protein
MEALSKKNIQELYNIEKYFPGQMLNEESIKALQTILYPLAKDIVNSDDNSLKDKISYIKKRYELFDGYNLKIGVNKKYDIINHILKSFIQGTVANLKPDSEIDIITPEYIYYYMSGDMAEFDETLFNKYRNLLPHIYYNPLGLLTFDGSEENIRSMNEIINLLAIERNKLPDDIKNKINPFNLQENTSQDTIDIINKHLSDLGKTEYTWLDYHNAIIFNKYKDLTQGIILNYKGSQNSEDDLIEFF